MKRISMKSWLGVVTFAAVWSAATPAHVRERQAADADLSTRVDKIFAVVDRQSPGCAVAIIRNGAIVYKQGYGLAELDHDIRITPSTVFQVGSVAKQFTATAILLLAQDGKLSLDDDVRKHIVEFPDLGKRVTIRQLLHHTSGVRDQLQLLALTGWRYTQDLITNEDVMALVVRQKALNFPPNTRYLYSNTGYTLLARIVERVSGKTLREFTTERIFSPLGMTRTFFREDFREIVKGQAQAYVPLALVNRPVPDASEDAPAPAPNNARRPMTGYRLDVPNSDNTGPTNLLTTVEDLAWWDRNFDEPKVGGPALIQQLLQRGKLESGEESFYAMGLGIDVYRGLTIIEHPGTDGGFAAEILRFPQQRFSVALTCNRAGATPAAFARRIADIYLEGSLGPRDSRVAYTPITLPDAQMAAYPGLYFDQRDKTVIRIARKPNEPSTLLIRREEFKPSAAGRFHSTTGLNGLIFESVDGVPGVVLQDNKGTALNRLARITEAQPTAAQMQEYEGEYFSDELNVPFRVSVVNGRLSLHRVRTDPEVLAGLRSDLFQVGTGRVVLEFTRDSSRRVTGFLFSTSRNLDLAFRKR